MHVEIQDLYCSISGQQVLSGVNYRISPGGFTAITGPSGSGKTTLLSLIAGAAKPTSGRVIWDEGNHGSRPPDQSRTCWIPQGNNALPARTALDNAALGALAAGATRDDAFATAQIALATVGLSHKGHQRASTLSGGELQRVCIARALSSPLPVILCDEPTSNLDEASTREVTDVLGHLQTDRLVVVATHDPLVVAAAGDVLRLR